METYRARLLTRHGAFVGYCDVPVQTSKDLPALPEVITLRGGDGRTFIRYPAADHQTRNGVLPSYREQTFDWAENFRLEVQS